MAKSGTITFDGNPTPELYDIAGDALTGSASERGQTALLLQVPELPGVTVLGYVGTVITRFSDGVTLRIVLAVPPFDEYARVIDLPLGTNRIHPYWSVDCEHAMHDACPLACFHCHTPCICPCHVIDPDDPVVVADEPKE